MEVILFQPQIPQNTGNIVRTCKVTGNSLSLVKPIGFSISSRQLKRAGLDYWEGVEVSILEDLKEYLEKCASSFYFFSSHAKKPYTEISYSPSDALVFGSETAGLHPIFWEIWPEKFFTIPMKEESRCLNLSNAVSIVIYEAWRQMGFK